MEVESLPAPFRRLHRGSSQDPPSALRRPLRRSSAPWRRRPAFGLDKRILLVGPFVFPAELRVLHETVLQVLELGHRLACLIRSRNRRPASSMMPGRSPSVIPGLVPLLSGLATGRCRTGGYRGFPARATAPIRPVSAPCPLPSPSCPDLFRASMRPSGPRRRLRQEMPGTSPGMTTLGAGHDDVGGGYRCGRRAVRRLPRSPEGMRVGRLASGAAFLVRAFDGSEKMLAEAEPGVPAAPHPRCAIAQPVSASCRALAPRWTASGELALPSRPRL